MKHKFEETPFKNKEGRKVFRCIQCALRTCNTKVEECKPHNQSKKLNRLYKEGSERGQWGRYYNLK